jgi:hypothetical protein
MIGGMADDPRADRHITERHVVSIPKRLWKRFGAVVGDGNRSRYIRLLVEAWLDGKPLPPVPPEPPKRSTIR